MNKTTAVHSKVYGCNFCDLILVENLTFRNWCVCGKFGHVKVGFVHINRTNLMVVIGGVVVDSLVGIAAGSVNCDFILSVCDLTTTSLLVNRTENVEKLAHTLAFAVTRNGVELCERNLCKTGCG